MYDERWFMLLLFPWARNFTPIASATQLLNQCCTLCAIRAQLKSSSIADIVIPVKNLKTTNKQQTNKNLDIYYSLD